MSKSSKNNLIRCLIFLILVALVMWYLCEVFAYPATDKNRKTMETYYAEEENTLDGVYIGASNAYRFWNGPWAFNEKGFAIYNLATAAQPLPLAKYLIEEVNKDHDPELIVIELRWSYKDARWMTDPKLRNITDNMKMSRTRTRAVTAGIEFSKARENDIDYDNLISYYIPLVKYHSRWSSNLTSDDVLLRTEESLYKGYLPNFNTRMQQPIEFTKETVPLAQETEAALLDLLEYCHELDQEVLFVMAPFVPEGDELKRLNRTAEIVEASGHTLLNFNNTEMTNAMGMNVNTDFYDSKHMNYLGAEKYTRYLAEYISENYEMKDHRGEQKYESWQKAYDLYIEKRDESLATNSTM